jgi:hypothetical protein
MKLSPITSAVETRQARERMLATLRQGCQTYHRQIGWQGESGEYDVEWHEEHGFWLRADSEPYYGRWVHWFGAEDPTAHRGVLNIVCELNPPVEGIVRQCAGIFVRDDSDAVFVAHSGKIGGGRKGIGKSAFLSNYRGALETVAWPDGRESEVIVLGRVEGRRFPAQVANFIREVQRFKASVAGLNQTTTGTERSSSQPADPRFKPEFSGRRRSYRIQSEIESRCDHGLIVNTLADALEANGLEVASDRRDLYVSGRGRSMKFLFEAKTDVTTSSIYQAIGQLLYHSALQASPPSLVMVLPDMPNTTTKRILEKLRIKVLVFDWQGQQPIFRNLTELIEAR